MQRDKLTSYICAISLHIGSFSVNPNVLSTDLALMPNKLMDFYRQLGCTIDHVSVDGVVTKTARLTAPIVFPKSTRGRAN